MENYKPTHLPLFASLSGHRGYPANEHTCGRTSTLCEGELCADAEVRWERSVGEALAAARRSSPSCSIAQMPSRVAVSIKLRVNCSFGHVCAIVGRNGGSPGRPCVPCDCARVDVPARPCRDSGSRCTCLK